MKKREEKKEKKGKPRTKGKPKTEIGIRNYLEPKANGEPTPQR
jgi:hypothetical protein